MRVLKLLIVASLILGMVSCQENESDGPAGSGKLKVHITDSPFPIDMVQSARVSFYKAEIFEADPEEDEVNSYVVFEDTVEVELLDLMNGVTEEIGEVEIPAGDYYHLRLYVVSASITVDGTVYDMKIPSGPQSGLKIFVDPPVHIEGGLTSDLLLDFDLSKSFVVQGNPNTPAGIKGFIFKPVIRAVNFTESGRIEGYVTDTADVVLPDAHVWVEQDSVIASTFTDSTGFYSIIGLPAGEYDVFGTKVAYDTVVYDDAEVFDGNRTSLDFELIPLEAEGE